ncbi:MAG: CapA family protein [Bacillaceae bacterium]|nr:CapA family protein [Bacillaceae bacterium]
MKKVESCAGLFPLFVLCAVCFMLSGIIHSERAAAHPVFLTDFMDSRAIAAGITQPKGTEISIVFAGDTMFDWSVKKAVRKFGPDYPFQYVKDEVKKADLAILNLETAVTAREEKDTIQLYNFKSDPISLEGVKKAGFDLVSLANNHTLDYKEAGLLDTLKYLDKYQLGYFGAGKNKEEAYQAKTIHLKGKKIKFLGFSRFLPAVSWYEYKDQAKPVIASGYQQGRVIQTIRDESKEADFLFVYMHWGVERNNYPEQWQRNYARRMIDAGADAIIGAHPHVLQGFEYYKGKPIAYSLGNFLFPDYVSGRTAQTGLLKVVLDQGKLSMKFSPYVIRDNQIHPLTVKEKEEVLHYLEDISYNITINGNTIVEELERQ